MTALHYRDHKDLSVNIAIYPTHYVKLVRDPKTNEWMSIERENYDAEDLKSEYHVLAWAMSDEFKEGRADRFWGLMNNCIISLGNNYNKPLSI